MSDVGADPVRIFHGIDFSGDKDRWTPGCGRSNINRCNVWIATAEARADVLRLVGLRPVQDLRRLRDREHPFERPVQRLQVGEPFERLVKLLADGDYCAAGIDAPFSLPERHMPAGGWPELVRYVETLPKNGRPFAKGEELVTYAKRNARLAEPKLLRHTEQLWSCRGLSVRSTLWNRARGGAAFTIACLTLLERVGTPVWPWEKGHNLLVEAFPACQLYEWTLSHERYAKPNQDSERRYILERISSRIDIPDNLQAHCRSSADALDAVLCVFAAKAAAEGRAKPDDAVAAEREGWIAVHPA